MICKEVLEGTTFLNGCLWGWSVGWLRTDKKFAKRNFFWVCVDGGVLGISPTSLRSPAPSLSNDILPIVCGGKRGGSDVSC